MILHELFWKASEIDKKRGYCPVDNGYICHLCGAFSECGIIYENDGILCDAEKNIAVHIKNAHGSVFSHLIKLDRRLTGLSEHQRSLMKLFYEGESETAIRKKLGIGSASTIRQHRFALREKERQAKIFAVLAELLNESESGVKERRPASAAGKENNAESLSLYAQFEAGAEKASGNAAVGETERARIIKRYFPESGFGRLKTFTMKEKNRIIILGHIASRFKFGVKYTESDVNSVLMEIYDDYVTLKRYLVDYLFMDRKPDGSLYWLIKQDESGVSETNDGESKSAEKVRSEKKMEVKKTDKKEINEKTGSEISVEAEHGRVSRKEMKRQYKEIKLEGGVFIIKNKINGKILLLSTPNLKMVTGKIMALKNGTHPNAELQSDWKNHGEESFIVEILETIDQKDEDFKNKLEKIEKKWLEKLNPFGGRGYNMPGRRY
ncbi:MAG: hypothetical protein A2008_09360 [Candidatus Wallbacteria bacterium GWC2_49_35]|uniref:DUF2087 domain-containing protein n=1 Tax=Candidatus Wallbacteria bacterium GWC2_49_35 TaxID=1817813 RepID=A0A1F7WTR5_9BACT|nr:MAG: hypothetical protein A2008_09360 [Candidatus Wallbacteria bacterium GWC2_49_35]